MKLHFLTHSFLILNLASGTQRCPGAEVSVPRCSRCGRFAPDAERGDAATRTRGANYFAPQEMSESEEVDGLV
ncbi:MAG: hypothetical protein BRC38_15515 [Cyanobacteria bacterium QH_6_48_35]|nr:MAG: hypothetical protein BRC38_15515 [Cyanobacteria bacterium QH_6_48_35]